ncbi:DUF4214 domain-containing protein [Candidatus Woesebacteria bacterium]|nr:DUF4214 domain-containing protein [Candidatus Woesebacteria bacterium]
MDIIESEQMSSFSQPSRVVASKRPKLLIVAGSLVLIGFLVSLVISLWLNNRQTAEIRSSADTGGEFDILSAPPTVVRYDSSTIDFRIARPPFKHESAFTYPSEITPLTFAVGGKKMTILSSIHSWRCLMDQGIIDVYKAGGSQLFAPLDSCSVVVTPENLVDVTDSGNIQFKTNQSAYGNRHWARTYWGITDASVISVPGNEPQLISVHHGENMNSRYKQQGRDHLIQGTIRPTVYVGACPQDAPAGAVCDCAAGYDGGTYKPCWESFGGFLSISATPLNLLTSVNKASEGNKDRNQISSFDTGPVIWPAQGYSKGMQPSSGGPYHPTLFTDTTTGYVYIFYTQDWGKQSPFDKTFKCVGAARARIGETSASSWQVLKNGQFTTSGLPEGFNKDAMLQFLDKSAGNGDCIDLPNNTGTMDTSIWFSIAKVANTPYFAALEEHSPGNKTYQLSIRLSKDLIHWSPPQVLGTADTNWGKSQYSYPTFYSKEGVSADAIDANEFYILGKRATNGSGYELNVMRACIAIPGVSTCPANLTAEEWLVRQYYREFLGWNLRMGDVQFQDGINWHIQKVKQEGCFADIASFLQSEEYKKRDAKLNNREYIRMLYRGALSREPDWSTADYWLAMLDKKLYTRDEVATFMLGSNDSWEARQVCDLKRPLGSP